MIGLRLALFLGRFAFLISVAFAFCASNALAQTSVDQQQTALGSPKAKLKNKKVRPKNRKSNASDVRQNTSPGSSNTNSGVLKQKKFSGSSASVPANQANQLRSSQSSAITNPAPLTAESLRPPIIAPEFSTPTMHEANRNRSRLLVTFKDESYLNRDQPPAGYTDYALIGARFRASGEGERLNGQLDLGGLFSANVEKYTSFEVPEAYIDWHFELPNADNGSIHLIAGRQKETWSRLDLDWDLGIIEPLDRFDGLRVTEQGLTGAFLSWRNDPIEIMVFATPVFLPEQGGAYELEDGQFKTQSPWFSVPPANFVINGVSMPARYRLDTPAIGSVVNHTAAGFLLRYGNPREPGPYVQAALVHKPRNTFELPFTAVAKLENTRSYGDVAVYPQLLYHNVATADVGYNSRIFSASFSALNETVDELNLDSDLTYQNYDSMRMLSPALEGRFFPSKFWGPRLRIARLFTFGGDVRTFGPNSMNGGVFGARTNFRQAFSTTLSSRIASFGTFRVDQVFRWIQEVEEDGTILSWDLKFLIGEQWRIVFSTDFLASEKPANDTSTFISRFRENDRASLGLTYVF